MPPRPAFFPSSNISARHALLGPARRYDIRASSGALRCPHQREQHRTLHTSRCLRSPTHYEALNISPDATQGEIKKQFYRLSKLHHPDHNPTDPNASSRFQALASAYAVLGSPASRKAYDAEAGLNVPAASGTAPSGSYSSAQAGARPASGLSKRRGAFRGPPPSFYQSGGWGRHEAKRRAAQSEGGGGGADMGRAFGEEVPHFDRQAHFERQEEMDARTAERRRVRGAKEQMEREALQKDLGVKVVLVSVVIGAVWVVDVLLGAPLRVERRRDKRRE